MLESTTDHTNKSVRLDELRAQLRVLERGAGAAMAPLALGLPALDAHLGGGLARGGLHEVAGAVDDGAAALGFCVALAGRLATERPVLWCQSEFDLYAPGLAAFGLDPARLILVRARRPADRLWAMEEGLRCRALAAAVIELGDLDMTAGRRLQLAAEAGGVTGLVLHPEGLRATAASAAVTRWRVAASAGHGVLPSESGRQTADDGRQQASTFCPPSTVVCPLSAGHGVHPSESGRQTADDGRRQAGTFCPPSTVVCPPPAGHGVLRSKWLGPPVWQVELLRCRGGRPGRWLLEWTEGGWRDATGDVALAAALRDRPDPQPARA